MQLLTSRWIPLFFVAAILLVSANGAYAQRIPLIFVWCAGASIFAPIVAVPVKLGILRLMHLQVSGSRIWILCAAEWLLWFPVAILMFRTGRPVAVTLVLPVVLAHQLLPEEVYPLLPCRSGEATAQLQQLVLRDRVHAVTLSV